MKLLKITSLLILLSCPTYAKNISVIATGGTIAGVGGSSTGPSYTPGKIGIDQIIKNIPEINGLAYIHAEQLMQMASQNMNSNSWLVIAKKVNEVLDKSSIHGVVITHGTDTLEETAYFLNLVVKSKKPVVLVGAIRPSTSLSADGALNLYNAVALATSDEARDKGVLVMLNDEIHAARDVTKTHTTNVATFKSPNSGAIGTVVYGKVRFYYSPLRTHTSHAIFDVRKSETLPKVEIVYAHAGLDVTVIDHIIKSGARGIVLAGVGDGNFNKEGLQKLAEAAKKGVIIVRSANPGSGVVEPNIEINDDEYGFVTADNLSPKKARILTMMALTKTNDVKKIREMFGKY